jgi:uncharacterized protein (TIGR02145 family)
MRKIFIFAFLLLLAHHASGQSPDRIAYQAVIRDTTATLLLDTKIFIEVQILQGSMSGTVVYEETQKRKTNANGLVSFEIGTGTIITGSMDAIDWSDGPYFIHTVIYPTDDLSHTITTTSQILSVPYALYADRAETMTGEYTEKQGLADVLAIDNQANSQIKNVANPTRAQDVVTKAYADLIFWASGIVPLHFAGYIADLDGNVYRTITMGTQTWMAENLRTTTMKDHTAISAVTDPADWASLAASAYCWYENVASNSEVAARCGALYNWNAVASGNLCPDGWHVPTQEEYRLLVDFVGGNEIAGAKLKENGTKNWNRPNTLATNLSGFTALPCGGRSADGTFTGIGEAAFFWTTTELSATEGVSVVLSYNSAAYRELSPDRKAGLSVRCLKD